jgi:hypothetical protein
VIPSLRSLLAASATLVVAAAAMPAQAQTAAPINVTVNSLINDGYVIVAASSDGTSQFLYLTGTDQNQRKKAYACQIQFGSNGGFRGCLVLP